MIIIMINQARTDRVMTGGGRGVRAEGSSRIRGGDNFSGGEGEEWWAQIFFTPPSRGGEQYEEAEDDYPSSTPQGKCQEKGPKQYSEFCCPNSDTHSVFRFLS
jgi:hypothetical protein